MDKYNFTDPDSKLLFAKVLNQVCFCKKNYKEAFSDFLDPVKVQAFLQRLKSERDISIKAFGGFDDAERQIIGFFPCDDYVDTALFPIKALKITYNTKFGGGLGHRDYLGSILALGINRNKIGDIVILQDGAVVYVYEDIFPYIEANLNAVAHTKVKVSETDLGQRSEKLEQAVRITISSLRLDAVISGAFRLSRQKALDLIKAQKVFLNWSSIENPSKQVSEGDVITLRGTGRAKIDSVGGKTKSGRLSVTLTVSKGK